MIVAGFLISALGGSKVAIGRIDEVLNPPNSDAGATKPWGGFMQLNLVFE